MPRDLPDLLGDALPRDAGAPDLGAIESRVARRRVGRLGGAVLALTAAVAVTVQVLPLDPPAPMIDQVQDTAPAGTTVLPLPPAGEVTAAHANGRPVFVVHDEDGDVRVLDAISPHPGDGMHGLKVLGYCARSGWFEDLWHGSKFAGNGAWVGGPAPYGLAEHTVVAITAKTVTIGPMAAAPARGEREGEEPTGESCTDVMGEDAPDALVLHDPAAEGAVPGLLYPELRDGEVVAPDEPQLPLPGPDATVPVPAPGEVSADHVNGRPVFVLNHDDGNVLVIDAVDPHVTEFGPKVLAWCLRWSPAPGMGGFPGGGVAVDLWYGSTFTGSGLAFGTGAGGVGPGGWTGGPASTGLGRLPVRTVTGETVTVAGSPLPAPPRVGNESIGDEGCSQAVSLFPDWSPADPTILDDLVLHEPLFEDDWWYPTPARILGEEPGLPPDELERYHDEVAR